MSRVIVVGGGVGGLTAAHELAERGFDVHVYEARDAWGGKARSQYVAGTGTEGRQDLPGEHGFRFYPRFYRHVIDTMAKIPSPHGGVVADRLLACPDAAVATIQSGAAARFTRHQTMNPGDVVSALQALFVEMGFDGADLGLFGLQIFRYLSSSDERRFGEYEGITWYDFLGGDGYSPACRQKLTDIPRMLVAMDAKTGNACTNGVISMQLLLDLAMTSQSSDRTMGGPTTEMWIGPWFDMLASLGVSFHGGDACVAIEVEGGRIARARFASGATAGEPGDQFVLAVPLEAAVPLMNDQLASLDPQCARLRTVDVRALVSWMAGIQFFLYEDVQVARGHLLFPDAPWALTAISQPQFWRESLGPFSRAFGAGDVSGLLSVDISEWNTPGTFVKKKAIDCTKEEVKEEVWRHLEAGLNGPARDQQLLTDAMLHSWHLDDDLDYSTGLPAVNRSGLLIHPPGSWASRPEAASAVPNLSFAADYVRTHTDLASMEAASEAGRRATNAILDREHSPAPRAGVWNLTEPPLFGPWKVLDAELYRIGRPHVFDIAGINQAFQAADFIRRFSAIAGVGRLDMILGQFKLASAFSGALTNFFFGRR
ncbi:MAG: hydroxysqualene dehydroxylase [Gemmatimonadaceae bacterium]